MKKVFLTLSFLLAGLVAAILIFGALHSHFFEKLLAKSMEIKKTKIEERIQDLFKEKQIFEEQKLQKEEEKKEEETSPLELQNGLSRLIGSAKNCEKTSERFEVGLTVNDYFLKLEFLGQIKGKEKEKCRFEIKIDKLVDFRYRKNLVKEKLNKGMDFAQIAKEQESLKDKLKIFVEEIKTTCLLQNEDLVERLKTLKEGKLPSFEKCKIQFGAK